MEHNIEKYPFFSDGEILSAGKLNNLTGFLHGQTASVSTNLLGYGIICGLEQELTGGKLTIRPGKAIFPDGTFYSLDAKAEFQYVYKSGEDLFFSEKEIPNLKKVKPSALPSDSVVALEKVEEAINNHCSQTSCDIYDPDKEMTVKPVLISGSLVSRRFVKLNPVKPCPSLKRFGKIHSSLNYRTLMKAEESCFSANRRTLVDALKAAADPLGIDIETVKTTIEAYVPGENGDYFLGSIIPDWKSKANRYIQVINKLVRLNNRGNGSVVVPPFFLSFLSDLHDVFNEFALRYNEFALRYGSCVLPGPQVEGRSVLILGGTETRTNFHPVNPGPEYAAEAHILDRMFTRILLVSEKFISFSYKRKFVKSDIQLVPSGIAVKFGDRPIPSYYKDTEALSEVWQADRMEKVPITLSSYGDYVSGTLSAFTFGEADGYTLQGAYDKDAEHVLTAVRDLIDTNGLDMSARIIKIPNLSFAARDGKTNYYSIILSALNKDNVEKLKKFNIRSTKFFDAQTKHEPEKYKAELLRTDRTGSRLQSIAGINGIKSLLSSMKDAEPLPDAQAAAARKNITDVSPHEFKLLYKYMKNEKISNRFASSKMKLTHWKGMFWRNRPVAAFSKLRDYVLRTYNPGLRTAVRESVGMHGTINLISYKGKVVFVCYS